MRSIATIHSVLRATYMYKTACLKFALVEQLYPVPQVNSHSFADHRIQYDCMP